MTNAQKIWEAFKGEIIGEATEDEKQALATAFRVLVDCARDGAGSFHACELLDIADELDGW